MSRPALIAVSLMTLVATGVLVMGSGRSGDPPQQASDRKPLSDADAAATSAVNRQAIAAAPLQTSSSPRPDPRQSITDTTSVDPRRRADAIAALGHAPKSQALPVLEQVVESGERQVDRQIALQSLHTLAIEQGDADERIRDVLRQAIYHSDDESTAQNAQFLLEDIETALAEAATQGP